MNTFIDLFRDISLMKTTPPANLPPMHIFIEDRAWGRLITVRRPLSNN